MVEGNLIKKGVHVDENGPSIIHDLSQDHTLVLQNSFILLNDENDIPTGEASLVDKEHPNSSTNMLQAIIDVDGSVSKRNVSLFPIDCGTPSGIRSLTNACIKSAQILSNSNNSDVDPLVSMQMNNTSMIQDSPLVVPITSVDEELSLDKRVVGGKSGNTSNHSAASLKSVKILKEFWGDIEDDDSASDINTDIEHAADDYAKHTDIASNTKSGRMTKKQKSTKIHNGKGSDGITSSEHIQTRSKNGAIKSNPKYA